MRELENGAAIEVFEALQGGLELSGAEVQRLQPALMQLERVVVRAREMGLEFGLAAEVEQLVVRSRSTRPQPASRITTTV